MACGPVVAAAITGFSMDSRRDASGSGSGWTIVSLASDDGATPQERQNAYARAQKELDGLIVLPATTRASIERKIAGEIDGGSAKRVSARFAALE